ncbi:MAG TPA: hypothetical protein VJT75_17460 [Thermoleophilaceae bacterium]|nr:hypothetical protein [Thermoleophilaceae bacterium]
MTGRADFTEEEWELVTGAPPLAGLIVATAQRGGTFRESLAMGKAYGEARKQHGQSELLDEITHARPKVEHKGVSSFEELKQHGLERIRAAVSLLEDRAAADEVDAYRGFVVTLAERVAAAHREDGVEVSEAERAAIEEIASAAGAATA